VLHPEGERRPMPGQPRNHGPCAMRCTVLTLTPCAAAITRTHGAVLLAEISQDRACQIRLLPDAMDAPFLGVVRARKNPRNCSIQLIEGWAGSGYSDQLAFYGFEQPTESPQARRAKGLVG